MNKFMFKSALVAAMAFGASVASGGIITHSLSAPSGSTLFPWSETISVPKYNLPASLGTLTKVTFTLTGVTTGDVQLENVGGAGTKNYSAIGTMTLERPDNSTIVITTPTASGSLSMAAFDGTMDFGGASGAIIPGAASTASESVTLTSGADLALFSGAGTIDLPISGDGSLNVTSGVLGLYSAAGTATVLVAYEYAPVPEPEVYGAVGALLCGGLIAYRRYKNRSVEAAA